ncbi:TIGR02099 family protein [Shewanella sp. 202IG2-18]|uniref:YhdP family protein n=1 Tax=Parashewanella hymeniacidonis TaxID=2807618 RepID=UPI00195F8BBF|nr:YhdP family protein [Parashewanella hymeniacidonis]MBM7072365.1 TIGR02099 family protein [Parashewanella hymeniacidonis]
MTFSFSKLGRFCWKLLAIFLVLFALAVSLIRGLLPHLDSVRQELISFVGAEYQIKAQVGEISAHWQAYGPVVTVDNLVLPEQKYLPIAIDLKQVEFKLDFWQTLLALSPQIENVIVDGVNVELDLDKLTQSSDQIEVANVASVSNEPESLDWLYGLLLEQLNQYSLSNIQVKILSQKHDFRPIHLQDFHWRNQGELHQGQGQLLLDSSKAANEYLQLKFRFTGDGYEPITVKGHAYLAANSLDIGQWSARHKAMNKDVNAPHMQGVVNLQAWADFSLRKWQSALVSFSPSWLQWDLDNHEQKFEINKGLLAWKHDESSRWHVRSQDFELVSNGKPWTDFYLDADYQFGHFTSHLSAIDVAALEPLLPLYPLLDEHTLSQWHSLSPQGQVGPISLKYSAEKGLDIKSNIKQLSWSAFKGIPGSSSMNADIELHGSELIAKLPSQSYQVDFGGMFLKPLSFNGQPINASFNFDSLQLKIPELNFSNSDIALNAKALLDFKMQTSMSLAASVNIKNVSKAHLYFPVEAMGHDLSDYLASALKSGKVPRANVVWNGNFSDFPYANHEGIFQAGFNLKAGKFRFQPNWPAITQLDLRALFQNERMDLWVNKGKLVHVNADGAHVFIPTLDEKAELGVQAELDTKGEDATEVLQSSALSDSVGEVLKVVQVNGPIKGTLDLNIPLYEGGNESIRGQVELNNNPVYVSKPGIELAKVTGKVRFHNDVVEGDNVTAKLFEQPLQFSFDTGPMQSGTKLVVNLDGQWDLDKLPVTLNNPMQEYYSGNADWKGKLKVLFNDSGYSLQANVHSDLLGAQLDLPDHFLKQKDERRLFQAEFVSNNNNTTLGFKLGKQFEFWGQLDPKTGDKLKSYDLMIGRLFKPGDRLMTSDGHLYMDVGQTNLNDWLPILDSFATSAKGNQQVAGQRNSEASRDGFFPPLNQLVVKADELKVFGQPLKQLSMTGRKIYNTWQLNADSDEFKGQVDFYPDWEQQGIKITAEKLHLFADDELDKLDGSVEPENPNVIPAIDIKMNSEVLDVIPPIALTASDFSFMGYKLGSIDFRGRRVGQDYQVENLILTTPATKVTSTGTWFAKDNSHTDATQMHFRIHANKFDDLAKQFNVDPGIRDSELNGDFKLRWQGAPYDFHASRLNGDVHFQLNKGHLSEVSDKGARIFSLFSLDSLLRKLSFDFSDVFGKGLYYNTFKGDLRIDDGVVKTTNTNMDAVAGTMKVRGYTDLMHQSLNYDIRFSPKLASSVPTVVLLSTSAWTLGIGAFALTKVLEPVIEVISEIRFRLTGTMNKPKLEELERKSKEIEIPEAVLKKAYPEALKKKQEDEAKKQTKLEGVKTNSLDADNLNHQSEKREPKAIPKENVSSNSTPLEESQQQNISYLRGYRYADQPIAMPKQQRCARKSEFYSLAA